MIMYQGHYETQKPRNKARKTKKKNKAGKIVLIILAVIVLLVAVIGVIIYKNIRDMFNKTTFIEMPPKTHPTEVVTEPVQQQNDTQPEQTTETTEATTVETTRPPMKPEDIINILVMGDSSRAGGEEARLADTMILVSMNTYTNTMTLTSILRDAFVKLPDYKGRECGRSKMTFCYNLGYQWGDGVAGGLEMTNLCLYNNFGIDVDYNVVVDFEHFINIIDYCGGVLIDLTPEEAAYLNQDTIFVKEPVTEGRNRLNGMTALSYARMRHAEGDNSSDIKRTARQRKLISALVEQFRYYDVMELKSLIESVMPFITTTMDTDTMMSLVLKVLPMVANLKIESGECPYDAPNARWGDEVDIFSDGMLHSVVRFDDALNKKHMREITEGIVE